MLKTIICVFILSGSSALPYGKVFPTRLPTTNTYSRLVINNVSELPEFEDIVLEVDNTRRMLELREGVETAKAKAKYSPCFTFRRVCGTPYAGVFGKK